MLTVSQKEEAGVISLTLQFGFENLQDVVNWTDSIIRESNKINDEMINISLAKDVAVAISNLNKLSEGCDEWGIIRQFLRRLKTSKTMSLKQASQLSRFLFYKCAYGENLPDHMQCFTHHWDAIDLAKHGVFGDPQTAISEFIKDIHKATR